MKYFGVKTESSGICYERNLLDAMCHVNVLLDDAVIGDEITVIVAEFTEEEFNALPEFEGF